MTKADLKALFKIKHNEDEIWEYDNNGITYFDFCDICNENLRTLEESDYFDSSKD